MAYEGNLFRELQRMNSLLEKIVQDLQWLKGEFIRSGPK